MKKLLFTIIATLAIAMQADAQSATSGDAIESQSFNLAFDQSVTLPARIYVNGVLFKDYQISELTTIATNLNVITFKLTVTGQSKGVYNFTATSLFQSGAVTVESLPSNVCTITVRPNAPGQLRKI